jgi:hypothetical protein
MRFMLLVGAATLLLAGLSLVLLAASGLEADQINLGRVFGRDRSDPRIGTLPLGLGMLLIAVVLGGIALRLRRR